MVLERLAKEVPNDLGQLCDMVAVLQEAPEYFPGSSKELKAVLPRFKELEGKIEDLCLFVQVTENILEAAMDKRIHLTENKQNIKRWSDGTFFSPSFVVVDDDGESSSSE